MKPSVIFLLFSVFFLASCSLKEAHEDHEIPAITFQNAFGNANQNEIATDFEPLNDTTIIVAGQREVGFGGYELVLIKYNLSKGVQIQEKVLNSGYYSAKAQIEGSGNSFFAANSGSRISSFAAHTYLAEVDANLEIIYDNEIDFGRPYTLKITSDNDLLLVNARVFPNFAKIGSNNLSFDWIFGDAYTTLEVIKQERNFGADAVVLNTLVGVVPSDGGQFIVAYNFEDLADNEDQLDFAIFTISANGSYISNSAKLIGVPSREERADLIIKTDEHFLIVGTVLDASSDRSLLILKIPADIANPNQEDKVVPIGGSADLPTSIATTSDGGFIIAGNTNFHPDFPTDESSNIFLLKINNNLQVESGWPRYYGNSITDELAYEVQQSRDGGYLIVGSKERASNGMTDFLIIKTDSSGEID